MALTWTKVKEIAQAGSPWGIRGIATDKAGVWCASEKGIYRSTDNGVTWTQVLVNADMFSRLATDENGTWIVGSMGHSLWRSVNNGESFASLGTDNRNWMAVATDKAGVWCAVEYGGRIYRSTDEGLSWSIRLTSLNWNFWDIATDENGVWCAICKLAGEPRVYRSNDNGVGWNIADTLPSITHAVTIDTDKNGVWCIGTLDGDVDEKSYIYRSTNNGSSFSFLQNTFEHESRSIAYDADGVWYLGCAGDPTIWKSTNNGAGWAEIYTIPDAYWAYDIATNGAGIVCIAAGPAASPAVIYRGADESEGAGSFSANALFSGTFSDSIAADAAFEGVAAASVLVDAVLRGDVAASVLADAVLEGSVAASFVAEAILSTERTGSVLMDALLSTERVGSVLMDALLEGAIQGSISARALIEAAPQVSTGSTFLRRLRRAGA